MRRTLSLLIALVFLCSCSASVAQREELQFYRDLGQKDEAWVNARARLKGMCPEAPMSVEEYKKRVELYTTGYDSFKGCNFRFIKYSNSPSLDDWHWLWLPSHMTIVKTHEEEARKRFTPKIYEEFMFAVAYHLAEASDSQQISPEEHRLLFNYAWNWMIDQTRKESILLKEASLKAGESDTTILRAISVIGLALAAGLGAYAQGYAQNYRPPTSCLGMRVGPSISMSCR